MDTDERGLTMEKPYRYRKKLIGSGGSCMILLPADWLATKKLKAGMNVVVEVYSDRIEIRPAK